MRHGDQEHVVALTERAKELLRLGVDWEPASRRRMVKLKRPPYALLLLRRYSGVFDALSGADR